MTHADIQGWCDFEDGYREAVSHFGDGAVFVEVGCFLGRSLCYLGREVKNAGKAIRVVGVELGTGSGLEGGRDHHGDAVRRGGGTLAGELHANVLACGLADTVSVLVSPSALAASLFADRSLDFVFLDAAHDYDSVKADIAAWLPKVRPGGWLAGDDFAPGVWDGVVRAVNELLPAAKPWSWDSWRYVVPAE